jgi:hypothetical protein
MRVDVRKEFAACVRSMNGVVLDDVLKNPNFSQRRLLVSRISSCRRIASFRKMLQKTWMANHSSLVPGLTHEIAMKNDANTIDSIRFT